MQQIIFATGNKAKLSQVRFIVQHFKFPVEIIGGKELFGSDSSYEEIGNTVDEVALNGALAVSKKIGIPVITEDTDFRIEALDGQPGIRAGEFLKNFGREGILERMRNVTDRRATISSAVAYATPNGISRVFINKVEGIISDEELFDNFPDWIAPTPETSFGGGYNAIFIPNNWNKTLAQISPIEALPWSYRERNFIDAVDYILNLEK